MEKPLGSEVESLSEISETEGSPQSVKRGFIVTPLGSCI